MDRFACHAPLTDPASPRKTPANSPKIEVVAVAESHDQRGAVSWARRACVICGRPGNLRTTLRIALAVGVVLTLINQLDVFVHGKETALTWVKVGLNFIVPFCVSNLGLLAGSSMRRDDR